MATLGCYVCQSGETAQEEQRRCLKHKVKICHSLLALENKQRRPVHRAGRNQIWCDCSPCKKQNYKHQSKKSHPITKAKRDIYNSEIYIISLKDNERISFHYRILGYLTCVMTHLREHRCLVFYFVSITPYRGGCRQEQAMLV